MNLKWNFFIIAIIFFFSFPSFSEKGNKIFYQSKEVINKKITESIDTNKAFQKWKRGFLDIHHINTGRGNASFIIFPDSTTLLVDAGELDKDIFEKKYAPLKATLPKPNKAVSTAAVIANYIKFVMPKKKSFFIDYGLITHFHQDHYGSFVALSNLISIKKIIDRDYPNYNFPLNLKEFLSNDSLFQDYQKFIHNKEIFAESLIVGSDSQIKPLYSKDEFLNFKVQNIKRNATIWNSKEKEAFEYFKPEDMISYYKGKYNENPLSLAIKISYGDFDYYTGGDNTGLQGFGLPYWFDVETPIAKSVGDIDVTTLNHHGNRDATNYFFVKNLNPRVVIQQTWCSDHPGQEVYQRLIYKNNDLKIRDIFSTSLHNETLITYGPWFKEAYKSTQGHIVVRVFPNSNYEVFILNDETLDLTVKSKFGPYESK